jgi:Xaa-Pro aminopeptidase
MTNNTKQFLSIKDYLKKFDVIQKQIISITRELGKKIRPGMTEKEIADRYTEMLARVGLVDHWYPILVYAGPNTGKAISRKVHLPDEVSIVKENDIVILDCTPINKTVWGNWSETFIIGHNFFYELLANNCLGVVKQTADFAKTSAKTIGDIFDYCMMLTKKLGMIPLDSRNDFGHSIFQVPEGQPVDKTPIEDRVFINEDYKNTPLNGIISIEPQIGRINPGDGIMYGSKQQEVVVYS